MNLTAEQLEKVRQLRYAAYDAFGTPQFEDRCDQLADYLAQLQKVKDRRDRLDLHRLGQ